MPVKERRMAIDPNYERFYEFDSANSDVCSACPAKGGSESWANVLNRVRGVPVHTNWPTAESARIGTVYICESPSNREFSHGLPSIGLTGQAIYKNEYQQPKLCNYWLDMMDAEIYRTNLVRCQADSGLQKRVDRHKAQRVNCAAPHFIKHLDREIQKIAMVAANSDIEIRFVVAIGAGFADWVRDVRSLIDLHYSKCQVCSG